MRRCGRVNALEDALHRLGKHLECAVCMSLPNERAVTLPCSHYFAACCRRHEERATGKPSMSDVSSGISSSSGSDGREFMAIVRGFQGVCAAAVGGVEARYHGSQIPERRLRRTGHEAPRTSASRVREIREEMARGKAAFLNARGKEPVMWGDQDGKRQAENDAAYPAAEDEETKDGRGRGRNRVARRRTPGRDR